jgi:putative DNA primase/helicase
MTHNGNDPDDASLEGPDGSFADDDVIAQPPPSRDDDNAWRNGLVTRTVKVDKREVKVIIANVSNAITFLRRHPQWRGVIAWNAFAERVEFRRAPPWHDDVAPTTVELGALRETDVARIIDWFSRAEKLAMPTKTIEQAVPVVAEAAEFHCVREYLGALLWDGVPRLATWLSMYCGAEQSEYSEAIGTRWMISAVARVMVPGVQVDCTLVLEAPQGEGKSKLFRSLVPEPSMYSETPINLRDKDSYQALRGIWIFVLDELDSLRGTDVTRVKNFLTATTDHYRPSYGKRSQDFPRQNVFAGTTNEQQYLGDRTGNRRYWPVRCLGTIDIPAAVRDRDQLWAEAYIRYNRGEGWHVDTPELRALCEAEQAERVHDDPWEDIVAKWLEKPYVRNVDEHGNVTHDKFDGNAGVTTADVLIHALEKRPGDLTTKDQMRVAELLRGLGYKSGRLRREGNGRRVRRYTPIRPVTDGCDGERVGGASSE